MGSCNFKNSKDVESIEAVPRFKKRTLTMVHEGRISLVVPEPEENNSIKEVQGDLLVPSGKIQIIGTQSPEIQDAFQEKLIKIEGVSNQADFFLKKGMWVCCKKGLKPDDPNQDDFIIVVDEDSYLLGVFDGHGIYGHYVSDYVHLELPKLLFNHSDWLTNPLQAMKQSFVNCHQNLLKFCSSRRSNFDCNMSGTTASVVYYKNNRLYISYTGDSKAILGRRTENGYISVPLTIDHKPEIMAEKIRIESYGGEIRKLPGCNPFRAYVKHKGYPGISMSRAIGDVVAQSIGIICVPDISEVLLTEEDEFIVLCTDGVWEYVSEKEAVDVIANSNQDPRDAATRLAAMAWTRWITNECEVVDDITVIVAYLPKLNLSN